MTPTEKILEQIREAQKLSEGATKGWYLTRLGRGPIVCGTETTSTEAPTACLDIVARTDWGRGEEDEAAASFIVASREGWPRTLRQLEEAVKALERLSTAQAFDMPGEMSDEVRMRLDFAREALSRIAALADSK